MLIYVSFKPLILSLIEACYRVFLLEDLRTLTTYSYVYCTRTAGPVVVGFDEPGLVVGEGFGALFIQVSVNQQIDSDVTVNVAVIAGSATEREG